MGKTGIEKIFGSKHEYAMFINTVAERANANELPIVIWHSPQPLLTLLDIQEYVNQFHKDVDLHLDVITSTDEEGKLMVHSMIDEKFIDDDDYFFLN